jgi:hypothetical protein
MKKQSLSWLLAALVLLILLYPEKLTIAPAYHVKVVDQSGEPMADTAVSELWQQASLQRRELLDQRKTDARGTVLLPERTVRAPLAERVLGCVAYWGRMGQTMPCGNRYTISAAGDLQELGRTETVTGLLQRQRSLLITLKQCDMREPVLC